MENRCNNFLSNINIEPNDSQLYELALTHSSFNADANTKHHDYERLEYIGDAVIGFVVADLIYKIHKTMEPGLMSKMRSYLVKSSSLASYARKIKLYDFIKAGHSLSQKQIEKSDKILEDVFEALIGAIYLDQGLNSAYHFIDKFVHDEIKNIDLDVLTDYKTKLQEAMQAEYRNSVQYSVEKVEGPAHDRTFTVIVEFNGLFLARGVGKSKKSAEENAAKNALLKGNVH